MPRFAKRHHCPSSEALRAHAARAPARAGVGAHLDSCEFCGAESRLLARAGESVAAASAPAPEMPLALRLFAESRLAQIASAEAFKNMRAA